ncbi:MAG: YwiC-like family protein [Propionibacterium sp.]|nr:YwiC-like family protein [Propionibacterium sp.]
MSRRASRAGWVPNQHGAWAILILPVTLGMIARARSGGLPGWAWPLLGCWIVGYFAFFAAGLWLKAPRSRRAAYRRPLLTYGVVSAAFGLVALAWQGGGLLWWVVPFAPLVATTAWLTSRRRDRDLLSGVMTVTASTLMLPVMRFSTPAAAWHAVGTRDALVTVLVWAYFIGTVLYVKTMIRERGHRPWWVASLCWHAAWLVAAVAITRAGPGSGWWIATFAVALARAAALPWAGASRGRRISPRQIGVAEIGVVGLVMVAALA